ncbi:MAG: hypothetical protein JWN37_117 [Candidatus Nomurabacteria bacterium]|nr:hypothetical protein [Candidatus Nomurabacteria bacterium]
MSFLVLAYPKISKEDFDFIQAYRRENDLKFFNIVSPHFTIVFSTDGLTKEEFVNEIKNKAKGLQKFNFHLKVATINKDSFDSYYHEFLVADTGNSEIIKIHDKLYSGILFKNLRFDIDFIPHIGIGNSENILESKKRVDELNKKDISILGTIDKLDIVEYTDNKIETLEEVLLD